MQSTVIMPALEEMKIVRSPLHWATETPEKIGKAGQRQGTDSHKCQAFG